MSKLPIRNVIIRDKEGNYFRICSFANPTDHSGEYYIKLLFPDIRDIPLIGDTTNKQKKVIKRELMADGVQEFTYHYQSGVAHYKADSSLYVDQIRKLPNLDKSNALHLIYYSIFTLALFKRIDDKSISDEDILIKNNYNGMPRTFEFTISSDPDVRITNIGPHQLLSVTTYPLTENGIFMTICVLEHKKKDPRYIVQLHRDDDPTGFLKKPNLRN